MATKTVITGLKQSIARAQGSFDSKSRFDLTDERVGSGNHCTVCGEWLRSPSAAYPYSVLKHCYSKKHALACVAAGICTEADLATEEREIQEKPTSWPVVKIVRQEDDRLVSVFDGETEYRVGETLKETAKSGHSGGFYGYEFNTIDRTDTPWVVTYPGGIYEDMRETTIIDKFREGEIAPRHRMTPGTYAVLLCRGEGRKLRYSGGNGVDGKLAFSRLTVERVLRTFEF